MHRRQLTGSLIAAPMLTIATSSNHLRHAIDPNRSEAAARQCQRPAQNRPLANDRFGFRGAPYRD